MIGKKLLKKIEFRGMDHEIGMNFRGQVFSVLTNKYPLNGYSRLCNFVYGGKCFV